MHALGLEFGNAAQLYKRLGSVWNCLWGNALKRSPGIIRKSRVSYPGPGFLSSATWPSLPKKHYNGLNQTKPNHTLSLLLLFCCRWDGVVAGGPALHPGSAHLARHHNIATLPPADLSRVSEKRTER